MNDNNQLCMKFIHCGNVSLANPQDRGEKNIFFMPMGLFAMADVLHKNGVDVEILHTDLEAGKDIHNILDFTEVDVVGFDDHWVNQSLVVIETAALIKQINPEIFVVMGGYTASLFAEEILAGFPQVDAVVRGDGEVPILELLKVLHEEKRLGKSIVKETDPEKLKNVQNLVWRRPDKKIVANDITYTATPADLEKLDFATLDYMRNWEAYRLSSFFYTHFLPIKHSPMFLLEVARGCEYACTFCGGNCLAQKKMNNRTKTIYRSIDSVLATIKKAVSYGFETFYTCIEWENSDDWYIELFNRIKEEQLEINYTFGSWKLPSPSLVAVMSEACKEVIIEISPETSDYELRRKNKDARIAYTNEEMEACLDYISRKNNVKVQVFFGFYVSGDTQETILNTAEYILKLLIKYPGFLELELANFSTDPGSLFFFNPEKYGIDINVRNFNDYLECLRGNYIHQKGQQADMTVFKSKHMTIEADAELRRKIRLLNYLFYSYRKSASYILQKTKTPEVIMSMVRESDIALTPDNTFPLEKLKKLLMSTCSEYDVLDNDLIRLIAYECEQMKKEHRASKPTVQLYMDVNTEEALQEYRTFDSMIDFIDAQTLEDTKDTSLDMEFDLRI